MTAIAPAGTNTGGRLEVRLRRARLRARIAAVKPQSAPKHLRGVRLLAAALELLSGPRGLSVQDLSARLELPLRSGYRLVASLRDCQLVEVAHRDPLTRRTTYRLGPLIRAAERKAVVAA